MPRGPVFGMDSLHDTSTWDLGMTNGLARKPGHFVSFLLRSALVGIVAGLVGVAFRVALVNAELWRGRVLGWGHGIPGLGWLLLPVVGGAAGALAGWLTRFAPETAGSGIPHVEAVLITNGT